MSNKPFWSSDEAFDFGAEEDVAVAPARPDFPSLYAVIMLNDDYTPMDFVMELLMSHFNHSEEAAYEIMINVHTKGQGVAGVYTKDVAETKAVLVNSYAQESEHPLKCMVKANND